MEITEELRQYFAETERHREERQKHQKREFYENSCNLRLEPHFPVFILLLATVYGGSCGETSAPLRCVHLSGKAETVVFIVSLQSVKPRELGEVYGPVFRKEKDAKVTLALPSESTKLSFPSKSGSIILGQRQEKHRDAPGEKLVPSGAFTLT
ncbi:hypothetical protein P7K49_038346 [Saguinus oedipus]|uniref:Uncharacterized protein n=1 Tax=Saguinus oedipus TaxID=9490 RepID=A0ABQ9TEX2_SAGOE|nr:hypothetical protein P7K49_038346 [Saguinus oedipus]